MAPLTGKDRPSLLLVGEEGLASYSLFSEATLRGEGAFSDLIGCPFLVLWLRKEAFVGDSVCLHFFQITGTKSGMSEAKREHRKLVLVCSSLPFRVSLCVFYI